ncbi:hypothetical protein chiPu_0022185 [Chiloscyllium punctatum]|uniref:Uncharacterized protein n=1 Tax=Chiloscyllium punctatum TaxID=137246 RepID=A0A401RDW4_CHIPU|nr:hypothetical protein [Chiloscyllium punctatum]
MGRTGFVAPPAGGERRRGVVPSTPPPPSPGRVQGSPNPAPLLPESDAATSRTRLRGVGGGTVVSDSGAGERIGVVLGKQ